MIESSAIDGFLAGALRALRASKDAPWTVDPGADWQDVWSRIEFHGIPFLLNTHSEKLSGWPEPLLARMAEEARLAILWETTHHKTVDALIQRLDAAGIASVMMKGTALAYSLHEEPATRRRGDTDLLVDPARKEETRAILKKLGWYRKDDPHGLYYQEGWLHEAASFFQHSVDLHWEPSDRPAIQQCLPIKDFFDHKLAMPRFGEGAFRPDAALMVLHATINQKWHAQHGYGAEAGLLASPRRLIWSVDFDLLIGSMEGADWARLYDHCDCHRVGPLVAEALEGMAKDLDTQLPDGALERLQRQPLDPVLREYLSNDDSLAQFKTDLGRARGLREKMRLLTMRAFPPRQHLVEKYPTATGWPTILLQGRLLVETAKRALRRPGKEHSQ